MKAYARFGIVLVGVLLFWVSGCGSGEKKSKSEGASGLDPLNRNRVDKVPCGDLLENLQSQEVFDLVLEFDKKCSREKKVELFSKAFENSFRLDIEDDQIIAKKNGDL